MPCDADLVGAKQDRWNERCREQCATANLLSQTLGAGPSRLGQTSDIQSGPSETSRPQIQNNATPTAANPIPPVTPPQQILGSRSHIARMTHTPVVDQRASQRIRPNYAPPQSPTCQGNNPPRSLANDSEGDDYVDEIQPLMEQLAFGGMNPNNTHVHPSNPFHMTPEPPPPHPEPPNPFPPAPVMKCCSRGHLCQITAFTLDRNGVLCNHCENCRQGDA
ncbi:hypothetical protein BS47DRAFT_1357412 [Hydnum rufescens UP504]|uniref:Uncharacterized protein n=1 Tax=Hydnum rufescens UP504 TaxID=1448309 RepID=A0A9P6E245_9AGAM|nr:hypothetical protein BS47DRAFT_1357412 [Hydnum rufescens UP504]